jgi:hypothetical protein
MDARHTKYEEASVADSDLVGINASRRRFTRAGLSGSVVLGSLASKPVLGASTYHCTVSGQISGNLSRPGLAADCQIGDPPSVWAMPTTSWPSVFIKGALPNDQCGFTSASGSRPRGTNFNGYTPSGSVPPLINAFFNLGTGSGPSMACSVVVPPTTSTDPSTMLQVLATATAQPSDPQFVLGRVVVASLLNAANFVNYPVTPHTIIAMFNATFGGGVYYPIGGNNSVTWSRARVIEYLTSLFRLSN